MSKRFFPVFFVGYYDPRSFLLATILLHHHHYSGAHPHQCIAKAAEWKCRTVNMLLSICWRHPCVSLSSSAHLDPAAMSSRFMHVKNTLAALPVPPTLPTLFKGTKEDGRPDCCFLSSLAFRENRAALSTAGWWEVCEKGTLRVQS